MGLDYSDAHRPLWVVTTETTNFKDTVRLARPIP